MPQIQILDSETIDKIAAGEVVERPASVVKELVENAIDAGAGAVTVEAKEGGTALIRVTDDGSGMEKEQLRLAFYRHATSKIRDAEDLLHISSLGFRGEALSSIAAVSRTEVITKTKDSLTGSRILLEGARELGFEEVGAPEGTTFLVRNLFFNTPARRKFLKTPATEAGYIAELMEHLALSRPDISFKFMLGSQTRFHTSGNGSLKEVIYRLYGRETAACLVPISWEKDGIRVEGYLGKPLLVRSNRNYEIYFINGRFVKSTLISRAVEEGYRQYLMQHKFPFCVLQIQMDTERVDVNVHPSKLEVRFGNSIEFCKILSEAVENTLKAQEMIPEAVLSDDRESRRQEQEEHRELERKLKEVPVPEPFEKARTESYKVMEESFFYEKGQKALGEEARQMSLKDETEQAALEDKTAQVLPGSVRKQPSLEAPKQLTLFEEKIFSAQNSISYRFIGQVFDTYWLIQWEDKLLLVDQHAAHEKIKYERLMKQYREKKVLSQRLMPPVIVSLTGQEKAVLEEYGGTFEALGFETEAFGGSEYALRSVPVDLYGCSEEEMFLEVLDELSEGRTGGSFKVVEEKIASMSCKAAVKGNTSLSTEEAKALIEELLTLENPYNCPHGRPTMITMSKTELERKFKRIV